MDQKQKNTIIGAIAVFGCLAVFCIGVFAFMFNDPKPKFSDRCVPASPAQMDQVRHGIKQISQNNNANQGWAVKSKDFDNVWFVAAEITGAGIEPKEAVGIWAMGGDPDFPNLIYSVDGFAKEFSYWIYGPDTKTAVTMFADGAQEAKDCVLAK